jgi:hypothetical protein
MEVTGLDEQKTLYVRRWNEGRQVFGVFHLADAGDTAELPVLQGRWTKKLDSCDKRRLGEGSKLPDELASEGRVTLKLNSMSFALYCKED